MERVKKIEDAIIPTGHVLIKIYDKPKNQILLPDGTDKSSTADYAEVVQLGNGVEDLEKGDIVLHFHTNEGFQNNGNFYALVARHNIKFAIKPDNFAKNLDIKE